ncbi:MAG: type II toxin-antitoxin system ParD family antitoxin [Bosea sp. (in: a-proteobacteria)]|uniref:type II toxin-antitoxin system ParD family antitoxin n=1 Tax=Bosea sp. (in: a-proteobacteria) TaxID=1871050 RepID=UPI002736F37C|nr:type II toxin-antitoxin system ParD family antitoxin [Bosea sp. (in: a-proteobacteria)]MDP3256928.1 type II toxin-antitoxin system ParD family antitoxin [Bosea sp. (in: a-proteobacteria)]MDP3320126.1 type II toxin-antitoxin system ParD family antitoxin [Bosea sp. (in: a-proteobacteria)]
MAVSADLGTRLEHLLETLVASGRYNSKSEILREGVRLVEEREKRLQALDLMLDAGLADAQAGRMLAGDDVFAELRARYSEEAPSEG